jgi:hypothetical protein
MEFIGIGNKKPIWEKKQIPFRGLNNTGSNQSMQEVS